MLTRTDSNTSTPTESTPKSFHVIAKPTGPLCNLDCKYCFYLEKEKLYPESESWAMSEEVLETYIRDYITHQEAPVISFAWQGGEPTLLGVEFFRKVVQLQRQYANGKRIENAFQTNGVLLNDEWGELLAAERFLVGLSIDGPREMHDHYRVDRGGAPSFDRVMRGLEFLRKHSVEFNTLTCIQKHNSRRPLEVYRFFKQIGSTFMQFIPIVERIAPEPDPGGLVLLPATASRPAQVSDWSVDPLQFGKFLCAIFDEWVRQDVGKQFVQIFDIALEAWVGMEPSLCVFQKNCGTAMAIEHNGDLFSCDHFVYPENRLGNIMNTPLSAMVGSPQQVTFGKDKSDTLPRYCIECDVRFICNGECPKHRFLKAPTGESGLNYLCAGYKHFFHHIDPCMRFMATELRHERPPANVMSWIRFQDLKKAGKRRPGRNDPCVCGSGKKYKKCCGAGG
jgi:uncharacterized protein